MAFWGIEIKPGKPHIHQYDDDKGRLHVSQATLLVAGSSTKRSVVQCSVGDEKPIHLCSLLPEKLETCALNHEFEEYDNVTFTVLGPHSVHLSGFYYGDSEDGDDQDEYGSDLYGDGVMVTDSEEEDDSIDFEDVEQDDSIDFEDVEQDDSSDDEFASYSPRVHNSGVRIEEIVDEEKPTNENGVSKQAKSTKGKSSISNDNENNTNLQIVAKSGVDAFTLESEDDDGFPKSAVKNQSDSLISEPELDGADHELTTQKTNENVDVAPERKTKRKIGAVGEVGEPTRENKQPHVSSVEPEKVNPENVKQKSKKKKVAEEKSLFGFLNSEECDVLNSVSEDLSVAGTDLKPAPEKKKEKKKKKNKKQDTSATPNAEEKLADKKETAEKKPEKAEIKSLQVRTFANGLMIEELGMGKPDGRKASNGKKVSVQYIGKLKKNGKIFDSNIGKAPFKFRLGIGQVIKGWDVGVNDMRVGDRRRLTIPPAMGYGAQGSPPVIPPNAWLVFDVELKAVN